MKSQFSFIFLLLIISVFHRIVRSEFQVPFGDAVKICASELGLSEDIMRETLSVDYLETEDNRVKPAVMCLLRINGMVNDKGELMKDVITKELLKRGSVKSKKNIVLIESCSQKAGTPGPDATWYIIKCVAEFRHL